MTYEQFKQILMTNRNDIEKVTAHHKHREKSPILVTFKGNKKPYSYTGSYANVLHKLGVNFSCPHYKQAALNELARLLDMHGEEDPFVYGAIETQYYDYSEQIETILCDIDRLNSYPFYDVNPL